MILVTAWNDKKQFYLSPRHVTSVLPAKEGGCLITVVGGLSYHVAQQHTYVVDMIQRYFSGD